MNRNIFTNNQGSSNNIFNNNSTNNTNTSNNSGQGSNIFTRSQANSQNNSNNNTQNKNIFTQNTNNNQGGNIFNNQSSSNNIFNNQSNQGSNNIFNNSSNNQKGNIFTNNNNNQGGNIFSNNNNQQGNIFNNNSQSGNIFNNNRQGNNIFNNNQQNNNQPMNNSPYFQDPILGINFASLNQEQQDYVFNKLSVQQIQRYIEHHQNNLAESKKFENIRLSRENTIKDLKINKLANDFNIKKEILLIKKTVRDNVCVPVKKLKDQNDKIVKKSLQLVVSLSSALEKQKQKLIGAIEQQKMLKDIRAQFQKINNQIEDFLRPLYHTHSKGGHFMFVDPDPFCISISEQILKNINYLDNKMDDLLACQDQIPEGSEFLVNTIEQLLAYFQNVAIQFQTFNAKYNELKRMKLLNHEGTLQKINKKARNTVTTQMKSYNLIKEIEEILQKRAKKANQ